MTLRNTLISFALAALFLFHTAAFASFPDPTGIWTGTADITEICPPVPGPAGTFPGTAEITVDIFNFNAISGTFNMAITAVDTDPADPGTESYTGSGAYLSPSQVGVGFSGTNLDGGFETWGGQANITGTNELTFTTLAGSESGGPNCTFVVNSLVLTRFGDANVVVNPAITPSTSVTNNPQQLTTNVTTTTGFLNARIQGALNDTLHAGVSRAGRGFMIAAPTAGLAAGDTFTNLGLWASYAHTEFDNDFFRTKYDGDTDMVFVGADFTPKDNMVLGLAIGYENTDTDTDFNLGQADTDGFTVAPYFGMTLDDTWSVDISGGYSLIDTDQYRTFAATRITSDVQTRRWFFSSNINGFTSIDQWRLSGRAGFMRAESTDENFSESNGTAVAERTTDISQLSLGGEAAYAFDEFEPFVSATFNQDLDSTDTIFVTGKQPPNDDNDVLLGFGFRYFGKQGLSVTAQYDTRVGREDYDEDTLSINARWDF